MECESFLYQGNAILSWLGMEKGGIWTVFCFYLLKMAVFMGLFYLLYKLLLSRESFSRFNRGVLLSAFVLSCVLPLWVFRQRMEVALPVMPVLQTLMPDTDVPGIPGICYWRIWRDACNGSIHFIICCGGSCKRCMNSRPTAGCWKKGWMRLGIRCCWYGFRPERRTCRAGYWKMEFGYMSIL